MKSHVALVALALAKIGHRVLRPLIGFGEQHPVAVVGIHMRAEFREEPVGFGKVLATGALAFVEIRHGVQPQPVHSQVEPEIHHFEHFLLHSRVLEVQVGLMREEAVPVIGVGHVVPGPVGHLDVLEDDAGVLVLLRGVAPDVELAPGAAGFGAAGALEPRVLVRGVVQHQLGDHAQAAMVRLDQEIFEVGQGAVHRVDAVVIGDVVTVILERRRIEREQPERGHAQVLQVIQPLGQAPKVPHPVAVAVVKRADVEFVDDAAFVPEWLRFKSFAVSVIGRHKQ